MRVEKERELKRSMLKMWKKERNHAMITLQEMAVFNSLNDVVNYQRWRPRLFGM